MWRAHNNSHVLLAYVKFDVAETEPTDELLITKSLEGSEKHSSLLVKRYWGRVNSFLRKSIKNNAIAEEVTQDTFLAAFRYLNTFKGNSSFYTWLCTIALNEASKTPFNSPRMDVSEVDEITPERIISMSQEFKSAISLIETLPIKQQRALRMKVIDGIRYDEIAAILGCTPKYAKHLVYIAKKHLRRMNDKQR